MGIGLFFGEFFEDAVVFLEGFLAALFVFLLGFGVVFYALRVVSGMVRWMGNKNMQKVRNLRIMSINDL